MLKNVVLLNIYVETMGHFLCVSRSTKESLLIIDQFNASLLNIPNPNPKSMNFLKKWLTTIFEL